VLIEAYREGNVILEKKAKTLGIFKKLTKIFIDRDY